MIRHTRFFPLTTTAALPLLLHCIFAISLSLSLSSHKSTMASPIFSRYFFILFIQYYLILVQAAGGGGDEDLIFEDGYTVSTVLDGDKSNLLVNPQSILHQSPPSDLFIILDSAASTLYTASLPTTSNETVIKRLAGNGVSGYVDGGLASAKFNKPKSFAVDLSGNIYIADHRNHAIRKITKSGVTTIAGGYSQKPGRADGPARDATFSDDFELTFIPERCALMISDHGNRLVRQISLKSEDCTMHSGSVLGTTSAWLVGVGLSCLISLAVGFVIRPYLMPYDGVKPHQSTWTWTHWQMSLERQVVMLCSDMRSVVVNTAIYLRSQQIILLTLSHLSLMFRRTSLESHTKQKPVSLLDLDLVCNSSSSSSTIISARVSEQLKDLLTFDEGLMTPVNTNEIVEREERKSTDYEQKKIDGMILANLVNFEDQAPRVVSPESPELRLGVVRRR